MVALDFRLKCRQNSFADQSDRPSLKEAFPIRTVNIRG